MTALRAVEQEVAYAPHLFAVTKQPVFTKNGQEINHVKALVRTDNNYPLSVVSDRYRLITNGEALERVKPFTNALGKADVKHFIEKEGARLVSQFTYKDRTIQLPTVGDTVALRIHVVNSYDGYTPLRFTLGGMVLRCLNGLMVMNGEFEFKWRHVGEESANEEIQLPDPEKTFEHFTRAGKAWDEWAQVPADTETYEAVTNRVIALGVLSRGQIEKRKTDLKVQKTLWGLYDTLTYALTHDSSRLRESGRLKKLSALQFAFNTYKTPVAA